MVYFHGVKWQQPVRWFLWICAGVVLLLVLAGAVLHIPSVQARVVRAIARSAGESLGLQVDIGKARLAWWAGALELHDVALTAPDGTALLRTERVAVRGVRYGSRIHLGLVSLDGGTADAAGWVDWAAGLPEAGGAAPVWHISTLSISHLDIHWDTDTLRTALHLDDFQCDGLGSIDDSLYVHVTQATGTLDPIHAGAVHVPAVGAWSFAGSFSQAQDRLHFEVDTLRADQLALSGSYHATASGASGTVRLASTGRCARWVKPWLPHPAAGAALDEPFDVATGFAQTGSIWTLNGLDASWANGLVALHSSELEIDGSRLSVDGGELITSPAALARWWEPVGGPLPEAASPWLRMAARRGERWRLAGAGTPAAYRIAFAPLAAVGGAPPRAELKWDGTQCAWRVDNLPVADALVGSPVQVIVASGTLAHNPLHLAEVDSVVGSLELAGTWSSGRSLGPFRSTFQLQMDPDFSASGELESEDTHAPGTASWSVLTSSDGGWEVEASGAVEGLQVPDRAWKGYGTFEAQLASSTADHYTASLGLRTITLVETGAPIRFDYFDAFCDWSPTTVEVKWASDVTTGNLRASSDLAAWDRWWTAFSNREPLPVPGPELGTRFTVARAAPLAAIFDLPLVIAPGTVGRARISTGGIEVALDSDRLGWDGTEARGVVVRAEGDARRITADVRAAAVEHLGAVWATDVDVVAAGDSGWSVRGSARDPNGDSGHIDLHLATDADGRRVLRVSEASVPVLGIDVALQSTGAEIAEEDGTYRFSGWSLAGPGFALDLEGTVGPDPEDALTGALTLTQWPELAGWGVPAGELGGATIAWEACGFAEEFEWTAQLRAQDVAFRGFQLDSLVAAATGSLRSGYLWSEAFRTGGGRLGLSGKLPFDLQEELDFNVLMDRIPLDWTSVFLPPEAVTLAGDVSGQTQLTGSWDRLRLAGSLEGEALRIHIPSLGTGFTLDGRVDIEPGMFALDNWRIRDDRGSTGRLTATILHNDFGAWNFDANLTAPTPLHLMELTRADNDLFYGSAFATGDVNVSGDSEDITIEARLRTEEGTTFALPLDAASDVTYGGGFLSFRTPDAPAAPRARDFIKIKLNLGIEVTDAARARIIFDEAVGDEIIGTTRGNLQLNIDDFERFTMNGDLEVVEGSYLFTLENVISKRFTVVPGGRIQWFGDPYAADIDLVASYRVRTRLNELLPTEADLPGRTPVDLRLGLKGNLLSPGIRFDVAVPDAESRIQALVESALSNEDELNRQAVSLLVLGQFFNPDPTAGAVGPAGLQNSGTGLLASQLGNWISSLTGGVDVGLDYGADPASGQQALAVALSTRLLDDRLQLEGAFGTNRVANTPTQDLQIQDIRVSYDLSKSGRLQVTGYTQTTPTIPGQDGRISQGVGIRMRRDFHDLGELWENRTRKRPAGPPDQN
jgi:hypothetical protein